MSLRALRFEMPFALSEPMLVRPELGIERVVARGAGHCVTRDTTLLDTADNRLLRAGIVLAHRVHDGLGEWYLDAPGWGPWLPTNRIEPLGADGDLPEEFALLVRPFRRSATLGPVAAITLKRVEWRVLGTDDEALGLLRDDRLTIRRGGVTIGRHREVTVRPADAMTREQRTHLSEALVYSGGTRVGAFPSLVERLGAPATGLTDFGGPREWNDDFTLEGFVSWLLSQRLTALLRADLELRNRPEGEGKALLDELRALQRELRGVSFALDPGWLAAVEQDLGAVISLPEGTRINALGDEYFRVLDAVVSAVRAPRLGDHSRHGAAQEFRHQLVAATTILFDRAESLNLATPDERWAACLASARQLQSMVHVAEPLLGRPARRAGKTVDTLAELLSGAQTCIPSSLVEPGWSVDEAFEAGRELERALQQRAAGRLDFIDHWPKLRREMLRAKESSERGRKKGKK